MGSKNTEWDAELEKCFHTLQRLLQDTELSEDERESSSDGDPVGFSITVGSTDMQ